MNVLPAVLLFAASAAIPAAAQDSVRSVVLVHGAVVDGSGWRAVHDRLVQDGFRVSVVQLPLTGLNDDVAATRRVIDQQTGSVVLVGQSYGGAVISEAGTDPKVKALVYVAALQPDEGERVADLNSRWPMGSHLKDVGRGEIIVDPDHFAEEVAADLPKDVTAFMAASQRPTAVKIFTTALSTVAWHDKPVFGIISLNDRSIDPAQQRFMYERSGATITELTSSHLPHISQPDRVAAVIVEAANSSK